MNGQRTEAHSLRRTSVAVAGLAGSPATRARVPRPTPAGGVMARWLLAAACTGVLPAPVSALQPADLWNAWPTERFVTAPAPCLHPEDLDRLVAEIGRLHPEISISEVGRSVEGRPIHLLKLGTGDRKVLLWSQMHGDEPSATPALLDLAHYFLAHRADPDVAMVLDRLTLLLVPMLNPDGAELYTRRDALAIDINRDALDLTTPEGKILKRLREEYQPVLGFNLHDEDRRRTAGDTGVLVSNSLLAVAGDVAKTVTPGRLRAKRACAAIVAALSPYSPGALARFDDTFSPRSFGDNLTAWGTPVVLIESGGVPPGESLERLTRLNFVAIGSALVELARNDLADRDPAVYDDLPPNNIDEWTDVVVRGGAILQPRAGEPYRADLAFNVLRSDRELAGCRAVATPRTPRSEIVDLGDARIFTAGRTVDATGAVILAPFTVGVHGWGAHRWLDAAALARLAGLGVARVVWVVKPRHLDAAMRRAVELAAPGRPRVEATTDRGAMPKVALSKLPATPTAPSLGARIDALYAASRGARPRDLGATLDDLWSAGVWPILRPKGPVSFTLLRPAGGGDADLAGAAVEATWLDGVELTGGVR